jgi:hypothetical protein
MIGDVGSRLQASGFRRRFSSRLPLAITAVTSIGLLAYGPIAQFVDYHSFADGRVMLGVPHAGDVLSNAGFAIVGIWGLERLYRARRHPPGRAGLPGYVLFCLSLMLTALGSTFYHLAPDDARLVWDRLPIATACAGLLAGVRAEASPRRHELLATAILTAAAVASVLWWQVTDRAGEGDLRPYLLIQALPLVLIPVWQWTSHAAVTRRIAFGVAILLYVAAKIAELNDHVLYSALGFISGHTLKHLLATMAAAVIVGEITRASLDHAQAPSSNLGPS